MPSLPCDCLEYFMLYLLYIFTPTDKATQKKVPGQRLDDGWGREREEEEKKEEI